MFVAVLVAVLLLASPALATDRYVDASLGANCLGTYNPSAASGSRCGSGSAIAYTAANHTTAIGLTVAGDTLYYRTGSYGLFRNTLFTLNSGTSYANAVNISAYNGEVVSFSQVDLLVSVSYVIFTDIRSTSTPDENFSLGGGSVDFQPTQSVHHIKFVRAVAANGNNLCLQLGRYTHHIWFTGGTMTHCGWTPAGGLLYGTRGGYIQYNSGDDHLIEGMVLSDSAWYGIHAFHSSVPNNRNVYRNNIIHSIGFQSTNVSAGILMKGNDNEAYNNIVYTCGSYAFHLWPGSNAKVYNNTAVGCRHSFLNLNSGGVIGALIRNNIASGTGTLLQAALKFVFDGGASATTYGTNLCTNDMAGASNCTNFTANVQFANVGANDYHLTSNSTAALDTGVCVAEVTTDYEGTTRPQGGGCDRGADELGVAVDTTPPAAPTGVSIAQLFDGDTYL